MKSKLRTILLVDDSATTRAMIKRVIGMAELPVGHVYEAENGKAALDQMQAHTVDLVLADLNMPVMDGTEMIRQMRKIPGLESIPVLVISAQPDDQVIDYLKQQGVIGYLAKPFTAEGVRNLVGPYLNTVEPELPGADESISPMNLTLIEAFAEALETMAFITPELPDQSKFGVISHTGRLVQVGFQGKGIHGMLSLAAPVEFGSEVSVNCGTSGDAAAGDDALKELANITCGLLLRRRKGGAAGFELAPPAIADTAGSGCRFSPEDSVVLKADSFLVAAQVTTDLPLFED
jgi:two-component system chemotaxis response regulator CheY